MPDERQRSEGSQRGGQSDYAGLRMSTHQRRHPDFREPVTRFSGGPDTILYLPLSFAFSTLPWIIVKSNRRVDEIVILSEGLFCQGPARYERSVMFVEPQNALTILPVGRT